MIKHIIQGLAIAAQLVNVVNPHHLSPTGQFIFALAAGAITAMAHTAATYAIPPDQAR